MSLLRVLKREGRVSSECFDGAYSGSMPLKSQKNLPFASRVETFSDKNLGNNFSFWNECRHKSYTQLLIVPARNLAC